MQPASSWRVRIYIHVWIKKVNSMEVQHCQDWPEESSCRWGAVFTIPGDRAVLLFAFHVNWWTHGHIGNCAEDPRECLGNYDMEMLLYLSSAAALLVLVCMLDEWVHQQITERNVLFVFCSACAFLSFSIIEGWSCCAVEAAPITRFNLKRST